MSEMSLLKLFGLSKKDPRNNHTFTDEDRLRSSELRKAKHEFEMKKLEIDSKKLDIEFKEEYGSQGSGIQEIMVPLLQIINAAKAGQSTSRTIHPSQNPQQAQPYAANISDEDIREFIKVQNPTYISLAKKAPKSEVLAGIMQKFGLDERQANRAYDILVQEF